MRGSDPAEARRLAVLFAIGLALRIAHVLALRASPLFPSAHPPWDDYYLVKVAWTMVSSDPWGGQEAAWVSPPPYLAFLVGVFALFGRDVLVARLVQALWGAAVPLLLYAIGRRVFGRRAAWVSAIAAAGYGLFVFYDGELLPASAAVLGTVASLLLLLRAPGAPWWRAAVAGAALGLTSQMRFNLAFFLPVAALWLAYADRARGGRRAAAATAALVAGMLVVLLPYLVRDRILPAGRHLFSHGLGVHVAIGNQPAATGTYTHLDGVDATARGHVVDAARIASRELARDLAPADVSGYWLRRALTFPRDDPAGFAALSLRKIHLFLNAYEIPSNENFYFSRRFSWVLRLPLVTWGLVAPLAMLGMALSLRCGRPGAQLLVAFVGAELVSMIPLFVSAQYRLTAVPALLLFGGYAVDRLVAAIEARRWRRLAAALAMLAAASVYVNLPTPLSPEGYARKAELQLRFALPRR